MTTAKTILNLNNYDEEFSGGIASRALTIEIIIFGKKNGAVSK